MARKPTKDDKSEPDPRAETTTPAQPTGTNLSPGDAAELMLATVQSLRQRWLNSAVTIANVLKNGQTVHRATFDDLRQARENYEELERARLLLRNMDASATQAGGAAERKEGD